MFFLLRSAFWLGIVFSHLPWNGDISPVTPSRMIEAMQSAAQSTARSAGEYCTASPAECLSAAQKLNALFEKIAAEAEAADKPAPAGSPLSALDKLPRWRAATGQ